ncbi:hypothetical protein H9Q13_03540 [Pontibacter sp. JH31]|uniref:Periplasmic protein n=1 Tax=Pontibacter aquaedesilientis TaxID=2766980 RepID=A0ABR7XD56_9BACT|nr:hypothetical protein [Pontibacter aquaedesilientis]MBD1396228.1 hypothetical protein [Pontibacter aquaedesilientis]
MKKIVLALALSGFAGAGIATPALACEGGKCTMEHTDKNGKTKKGKKAAAKDESCHMTATAGTTSEAGKTPVKSCCAKPEASKAESGKETKNQR